MGCMGSKEVQKSRQQTYIEQTSVVETSTELTSSQIREFHTEFLRDCPDGNLDQKQLVNVYQQFYPQGTVEAFCQCVFTAIDANKDGSIDFSEYLLHIAAISQNNLEDRLEAAFNIYDKSGNGLIDEEDLTTLISASYDLLGETDRKGDRDPKHRAAQVMAKLDVDENEKLGKQEFINGCRDDLEIRRILAPGIE